MKNAYVSIDVGSESIKVAVCQLFGGKLNLLAASSVKSEGIKKGIVTNKEFAKNAIKKAMNDVEEMLGLNLKQVILSIPNEGSESVMVHSQVPVDKNRVINGEDVEKVLSETVSNINRSDMEFVNILPIDFEVDNMKGLTDPKGKRGSLLKVRAVVTLAPKKNIYALISILEEIGVEVVDISLNGVGDIYTFKTKQISNEVGAIVNVGYDKTDISLYNKGIMIKGSTIAFGSKNIDGDIAYIYKLNLKNSILLKEKFALAHKRYASKDEFYEVTNKYGETVKVNQFEISEVVMSRFEEIFSLARKEINFLTKREVDYIIVTGGTSNMENFDLLTKEVLGNIANVGEIRLIGLRNNKYSSAVGNIIYFINKLKLRNMDFTMLEDYDVEDNMDSQNLIDKVNDTMLGKVFGYFFND